MARSPFIAYFDESGNHDLDSIERNWPTFVLCCALYRIDDYLTLECPRFSDIKFRYWFHDALIFHSYEIRNATGDFESLKGKERREAFYTELADFFRGSCATLIAAAIRKRDYKAAYTSAHSAPVDPYEISAQFCLERLYQQLRSQGGLDGITYCVFEQRGKEQDAALEAHFTAVCEGQNILKEKFPFRAIFASKGTNMPGLQIADLAAYTIARYVETGNSTRLDWQAVEPRIRRNPYDGSINGWGLKIFPLETPGSRPKGL